MIAPSVSFSQSVSVTLFDMKVRIKVTPDGGFTTTDFIAVEIVDEI